MRIKTNHKDEEVNEHIMDWLYKEWQVMGNEEELKDEPLTNLLVNSDWWELEAYLSDIFDEDVELPKTLKFIEF
jgi:hypothetical protein